MKTSLSLSFMATSNGKYFKIDRTCKSTSTLYDLTVADGLGELSGITPAVIQWVSSDGPRELALDDTGTIRPDYQKTDLQKKTTAWMVVVISNGENVVTGEVTFVRTSGPPKPKMAVMTIEKTLPSVT